MKKFLILASLAFGMSLNGVVQAEVIWKENVDTSAKEYVPLVNYDRIWESYSFSWFEGPMKYMKFDGTEEINGKTYHRIVTFKETLVYDGKVKDDGNVYPMDVYEIEGYIR